MIILWESDQKKKRDVLFWNDCGWELVGNILEWIVWNAWGLTQDGGRVTPLHQQAGEWGDEDEGRRSGSTALTSSPTVPM